jgi:uncharacterized membrane protein HdeD (DUF308 family)
VGIELLYAALALIAGIYILAAPLSGTVTLTFVLCFYFFAIGVVRIAAGLSSRGLPGAGWVTLNGVLSLLIGLLILVDFPSSASWAIGLLVGIDFLFFGMGAVQAALAGRRLTQGAL